MNISLLIAILVILFSIYIWMGKKASLTVVTQSDYFLMGRNLTFFPLSMTLLATMLGGGVLIGAAQAAYATGWSVIVYPLGTLLGFVALGSGFGARLRQLELDTIPEIFEKIYGSSYLRSIAACISILSLFAILVGQGIAIKSFFVTVGITNPITFYGFWAAFVAYTTMGGFKAVVDTDVLQALFIIVGLAIALCSIRSTDMSLAFTTIPSATSIPWTYWFLMPLCFILIGQDMGQRCFATKNAKMITPAACVAGVLLLFGSGVAIMFGLLAKQLAIEIPPGSNILITSVQTLTNPINTTLFSAVILMAIASTADSLLCAISSNICSDFPIMQKFPKKKQLYIAKTITFLLGLSALIFTVFFDNIVNALMFSYEFSISTLFVAIVLGVLLRKPSKKSAIAAMSAGFISFLLFRIISTPIPKEILSLFLSFAAYGVIYHLEAIKNVSSIQYTEANLKN